VEVPVEKQVLIALWYVGSLDTIGKIADRFGVSESTVIMCRERVTAAILNNLKETKYFLANSTRNSG
jgi:transposase